MTPKGGTFLFLLIMACAALGLPPGGMSGNNRDFRSLAKKLMMKCQDKGYPKPETTQLKSFFNSDMPAEDRKSKEGPLSMFLQVLHSGFPEKANNANVEKMTNKMWNCSRVLAMARLMRNSSVTPVCYMRAFLAPLAWKYVTTQSESNLTPDDYDTLLWASKPMVVNMPSRRMDLPRNVLKRERLRKMMKMLREAHDEMSKDQSVRVIKWLKEQITQKYFNCTTGATSDSRPRHCKPLLKWLNSEALTIMGPYLFEISPDDVESSQQLCEHFRSGQLKSAMNVTMKPSLGRKFVQIFRECFNGKEENVDKLGILACHYSAPPNLTLELSRKLLAELNARDDCYSPRTLQLKKRLVQFVMSKTNDTLDNLGKGVALLSPKQLSEIPKEKLKQILRNLGSSIKWTRAQRHFLVKKLLCPHVSLKRCGTGVSPEELMAFQSVAGSLPNSVFKDVKTIPKDKEALRNMSMQMKKRQLMAMLHGFLKEKTPREVVSSLPGPVLGIVSLNNLEKANILSHISLDQVLNKTWSRTQAAYLAKRIRDKNQRFWGLRSLLRGIICKIIDKVPDSDVEQMAQDITENPQWLSKMQAGCAARKLFATKFKNMTMEEIMSIPTPLFIHLPPSKVEKLSDSACTIFLDKMEEADLSLLPYRSPSRPALTRRALLCLTTEKGTDLSGLNDEDLSRLGPLLCELKPSVLLDMAPDVIASSLQEMASCKHIPQRHRADLIQVAKQTFGNPSNWSAEMMEDLAPLLLLDDDATAALPDKPWMKDVLFFLMSGSKQISSNPILRRKLFNLIITGPKKRAVNGIQNVEEEITVEKAEELGMANVYWSVPQLTHMSNETFLAALETLSAVPDYNQDQLAALIQKASEIFGPVSQMNESVIMQLGCITRGFRKTDLEALPLSLDNVEEISGCIWTDSEVESVCKGILKYNNLTAQQLEAEDIVALGQFICGLDTSKIRQLNMDAFKDTVGLLGEVQCPPRASQELKKLAVSAFGDPSNWSEARVSELCNIVAGLNSSELASLDPSVFSFICVSAIPHMQNLSAIPVAHLEGLGPDNAAEVTSEQKSTMNEEQLDALDRAETGTLVMLERSSEPVSPSGSPSLTVEGFSAFLKPFLVLITGFMLL